jgi:hypothetical protein
VYVAAGTQSTGEIRKHTGISQSAEGNNSNKSESAGPIYEGTQIISTSSSTLNETSASHETAQVKVI